MALVDTPRTHTEVQGRTAVRTVPLSAERTATGLTAEFHSLVDFPSAKSKIVRTGIYTNGIQDRHGMLLRIERLCKSYQCGIKIGRAHV